MSEKRFVLERSDYDLKYEFRVADISRVEKTKEDFWNEEEEIYEYRKYIAYLLGNDAFLTLEEADELLNALHEENQKLQKVIVENEKLIQLAYNENERLRNKNKRLHKDWDKIYELCREHLTDEEIIKELDG